METAVYALDYPVIEAAQPLEATIAEQRRAHLEALPSFGFNDDERAAVIEGIAATGMPVAELAELHHRPNNRGEHDEHYAGTWGVGAENYGQFSLYDIYSRSIPEQKAQVIAHELMHANTPFREANAYLYGSDEARQEAAGFVTRAARQSLKTGKYIDGYHADLARRYKDPNHPRHIDFETFCEETSAILAENRLTNPRHLEQVEAAQLAYLRRHRRDAKELGGPTRLTTPKDSSELEGIDKMLSVLMGDLKTPAAIDARGAGIQAAIRATEARALSHKTEQAVITPSMHAAFEAGRIALSTPPEVVYRWTTLSNLRLLAILYHIETESTKQKASSSSRVAA